MEIQVIADGIGGGIRTVSTFIPVVFFLYLFLAVLEDSGYILNFPAFHPLKSLQNLTLR